MVNETKNKLKTFHDRIERLKANHDFFTNVSWGLDYKEGAGVKMSFIGPDSKTIKAFLLDFRPFILNDEQINFNHISSQIFKELVDKNISVSDNSKKALEESRDGWSKLLERRESFAVGGIRLKIDNSDLISEKNLDLWLNGEYFHLSEEKRQIIERFNTTPFGPLSHFVFIDLLQRLSGILFWFDKNVVVEILKQYESSI